MSFASLALPRSHHPLEVFVQGDKLHITVGVGTLVNAVKLTDYFSTLPGVEVTDEGELVDAIVSHLVEEDPHTGLTPVHRVLDCVAIRAVEQGCEGVELAPEPQADLDL